MRLNHLCPKMFRLHYLITLLLLVSAKRSMAQYQTTLGFSIGYASLGMDVVNKDLQSMYDFALSNHLNISPAEYIGGGFIWGGQIFFRQNDHHLGIAFDQVSGIGGVAGADATGGVNEKYEVGTTELLGVVGFTTPVGEATNLSFRFYAGLGMASLNYTGKFDIYSDPGRNLDLKSESSSNYFAGRIQFGVEKVTEKVIVNFALGYRLANAGHMEGYNNLYGSRNGPEWIDSYARSTEFDFSGFMLSFELNIPIWGTQKKTEGHLNRG